MRQSFRKYAVGPRCQPLAKSLGRNILLTGERRSPVLGAQSAFEQAWQDHLDFLGPMRGPRLIEFKFRASLG
jgi:hypothetical protein